MENLEEKLRNIDIFCRVLVKKIAENENALEDGKVIVEPIEKLLRRKYIIEDQAEESPLAKHLIPLSHADEPLVDVFEDDKRIRVLIKWRCNGQKITVRQTADGLEICAKECRKLDLPIDHLKIEGISLKCNSEVLHIDIPKINTSTRYCS